MQPVTRLLRMVRFLALAGSFCCTVQLQNVSAATIEELEAEIAELKREIQELRNTATPAGGMRAPATPPTPAARNANAESSRPSPVELLGRELKAINFDRPLSAAPAFVALDVSPETVDTPRTPREFAASVLNGANRDGKLQTGLALEVAPYQVFLGPQTDIKEYQSSFWTRFLYNASLSVATTKAAEDDDNVQRLALGLNLTIFDSGDPRMDPAVADLFDVVAKRIPPFRPPRAGLSEAELAALAAAHYERWGDPNAAYFAGLELIETLRAQSWSRSSWNIAWAPTWISPSGKVGDLAYEGSVAWTSYAYGFEGTGLQGRVQLIGHLRFREGEEVMDPEVPNRIVRQDSLLAAARLRWGRADLNFSVEGGYLRYWGGLDGDRDAFRFGFGMEKRISADLWLTLSVGEDVGAGSNGDEELFAIGALRFGAADSPRFKQ